MLTLPAFVEEVEDDLLESDIPAFNKSLWLALRLDLFVEGALPPCAPPLFRGRRNKSDVEDDVPVCSFWMGLVFVWIALCPILLPLLLLAL